MSPRPFIVTTPCLLLFSSKGDVEKMEELSKAAGSSDGVLRKDTPLVLLAR